MLLVKAQRKRQRIAEGQTVTYNISGRLLKYKKVGGVMKYAGVAAKVVKKVKEPVVGVKKLNKDQSKILKETGILCKDDKTLKYVRDEMTAVFKSAIGEIDYEKVPDYVRYVMYPDTGTAKYTPNKISINMDKIIEMEKKYGVKMFNGVPKNVMGVLNKYKKFMEKQYSKDEKIRELLLKKKELSRATTDSMSKVWKVRGELLKKYQQIAIEKYKIEKNIPLTHVLEWSKIQEAWGDIPTALKYDALDIWGVPKDNIEIVRKDTQLLASERKKFINAIEEQIPSQKKLTDFKEKYKSQIIGVKHSKEKKEIKKDIALAVKNAKKQGDFSVENWFKAIYIAYYTNRILLPKVKRNPKLITAKEAYKVADTESLRRLFIQKRGAAYKTEVSRKKLLSAISEEGQEKMTFSLKEVSSKEKDIIFRKMKDTFDEKEHGSFGFKIHSAFKINDTSYYKEYKKIEKDLGDVTFSYHGTEFGNAAKIARGGFKVVKPRTGRLLGDGIYGANNSSKAMQYVGKGWGRQIGTRGVLFVCKNALGKQKVVYSNTEMGRENCNEYLKTNDTVYAPKGIGGFKLRNVEWCCKNPKQFLPIYWIDVELANPGTYTQD